MMKGVYHVRVSTKRLIYDLDIRRKITVIRGDSGTGKSTLVDLIASAKSRGTTGIQVISKVPCNAVVDVNNTWRTQIERMPNSIVFIDEDEEFIRTDEFAEVVGKSDNYFVIITRAPLENLPYSVNEIYEMDTSGKYHTLKRMFSKSNVEFVPDIIITEDSKSGYEFFKSLGGRVGSKCISANGKSNIQHKMLDNKLKGKNVLVVADGAAFGSNVEKIIRSIRHIKTSNVCLFLPESFEYVLLSSIMFKEDKGIQKILENPYDYIDASYISWEKYFEELLIKVTQGTPARYSKSKLSTCYINNCCDKDKPCKLILKLKGEDKDLDKIELMIKHIPIDFLKLMDKQS